MRQTLVVQAKIAELTRVWTWADALGQSFGLGQSTVYAIHLCLEEALSNIARYAFDGGQAADSNFVRLAAERLDDAIVVTIEDHGIAFDPLAVTPPAPATTLLEAPEGGRGIPLMRHFSRHLAYERRDGANRLTLRFGRT
jgi:serine/threonine-protein kinase RsbW